MAWQSYATTRYRFAAANTPKDEGKIMTLTKTGNQSTVTVSGHEVELHIGGSGPPLLFLHGGEGFGTYDPTTGPLAERFTVYAPSHPGFFGTTRPATNPRSRFPATKLSCT